MGLASWLLLDGSTKKGGESTTGSDMFDGIVPESLGGVVIKLITETEFSCRRLSARTVLLKFRSPAHWRCKFVSARVADETVVKVTVKSAERSR
jgi:hypothetical protein